MTHTYQITGMTCNGCAATIEKALKKVSGVVNVSADVNNASATVDTGRHVPVTELVAALAPYPHYQLNDGAAAATTIATTTPSAGFWVDGNVWKRASLNTLNCLIGCSIGDFGMILFLQKYYPQVSMSVQMVLAVVAGLATSVMLETLLLRIREKFIWMLALQTAISMSFISMVGMEVAMNLTDFMLTGGKAAFDNPMYWTALGVAAVAGFLAPLPYNYYKLKKYNLACH